MEACLQDSIEQYQQILEHTQQLEDLLQDSDPEKIKSYTARLNELQKEAGLNDREMLAEIARDTARWQVHPLFQQRMQLLEQIVEMNDLLLPKIRGMMSVTAAELGQLKDGRVAVSGYHPDVRRPKKATRGIG